MASQIMEAYNKYKSVLVIGGKQRDAAVTQALSNSDLKEQRFHVVKTNNMGRRQKRILVVDQQRQDIRSFDNNMRLRVILPLDKLQQLENLEADDKSLELSFEEGIYSYCELQFASQAERTRFIECIMKQHESVEKTKQDKTASEPLNQLKRQMDDIATLLVSLHNKAAVTKVEKQEAMDRLTETLKAQRPRKKSMMQRDTNDGGSNKKKGKISPIVNLVLTMQKKEKAMAKEKAKEKAKEQAKEKAKGRKDWKKSRSMHMDQDGGGGGAVALKRQTMGTSHVAPLLPVLPLAPLITTTSTAAESKERSTERSIERSTERSIERSTERNEEEMPLTPARERRKSRLERLGTIRTRRASREGATGGLAGSSSNGGGGGGASGDKKGQDSIDRNNQIFEHDMRKEVKSSSLGKQEVKSSSPESAKSKETDF